MLGILIGNSKESARENVRGNERDYGSKGNANENARGCLGGNGSRGNVRKCTWRFRAPCVIQTRSIGLVNPK